MLSYNTLFHAARRAMTAAELLPKQRRLLFANVVILFLSQTGISVIVGLPDLHPKSAKERKVEPMKDKGKTKEWYILGRARPFLLSIFDFEAGLGTPSPPSPPPPPPRSPPPPRPPPGAPKKTCIQPSCPTRWSAPPLWLTHPRTSFGQGHAAASSHTPSLTPCTFSSPEVPGPYTLQLGGPELPITVAAPPALAACGPSDPFT